MAVIGENYRKIDCCSCCGLVEAIYDYDEAPKYFCNRDKSIRPRSGSVGMDEFDCDSESEEDNMYEKWEEWKEDRDVDAGCICDSFQRSRSNPTEKDLI